jgi:hypothetical protein
MKYEGIVEVLFSNMVGGWMDGYKTLITTVDTT